MMAAGAIAGPQVIALSSNDFDYTFASDKYPVAGNPLGDHSIGAYWKATGSNNNISTLITLDGDFEITFTLAESNQSEFGVYAIDEDGTRTADQRAGMSSMTNSFWYRDESVTDFMIGSSAQSDTHTFADGSVVKIERVSGTIKVYDDDVVVHTYGTTYSGTMRFASGDPGPQEADYDNFKITDTDKVQRDGFINEAGGDAGFNFGDAITNARNVGTRFKATRTGSITTVKFVVGAHVANFDAVAKLYSDDGTSPASQIGSDSTALTLSSTGTKLLDCTGKGQNVVKGTSYWIILNDSTADGNGDVDIRQITGGIPFGGAGYKDVITDITDHATHDVGVEIIVDTSAGEPTPDHEVIFQVQSNDTNGSTSFTDESQAGSAVSAVDGAHHDNGQAKFGTTSIYCDGTDDEITIADHIDYSMASGQAFTWEWWMYVNGTPANNTHCAGQGTDATANMAYWSRFNNGGTITVASGNGSTARYITCTTNLSNAWHHIAYIHIAGKSYLCIDGTSEGSPIAHTDIVQNVAYPFTFGGGNDSASHVNAWFESMRLSRTARYDPINGFTPPVARFSSS